MTSVRLDVGIKPTLIFPKVFTYKTTFFKIAKYFRTHLMCLSGFREAIIIVFEDFLETKKVDSQTLIMQEGG